MAKEGPTTVSELLAKLRLDASQYRREMRESKRETDALARTKVDIKVTTNAAEAAAKVEAARAAVNAMDKDQAKAFRSSKQLESAQRSLATATERVAQAEKRLADARKSGNHDQVVAAERQLTVARRAQVDATDRAQLAEQRLSQAMNEQADSATKAHRSSGLLLTSIVALGPAIIPIAGAAAAGFGAMAVAAGDAALAVHGIKQEIKAGSGLGQAYKTLFAGASGSFSSLSRTAATAAYSDVAKGVGLVRSQMGLLNRDTTIYTHLLGDTAVHGLDGILAGYRSARPLIRDILDDVDGAAARFDSFATGGGFDKFVSELRKDLPDIEHDVAAVAEAIGKLLAAGAGQGLTVLNLVGELADGLNHIPLPVLRVLAPLLISAYTAVKLYKGAGSILDRAAASIGKLGARAEASAAQTTAAATETVAANAEIAASNEAAARSGSLSAGGSRAASKGLGLLGAAAAGAADVFPPLLIALTSYLALRPQIDSMQQSLAKAATTKFGPVGGAVVSINTGGVAKDDKNLKQQQADLNKQLAQSIVDDNGRIGTSFKMTALRSGDLANKLDTAGLSYKQYFAYLSDANGAQKLSANQLEILSDLHVTPRDDVQKMIKQYKEQTDALNNINGVGRTTETSLQRVATAYGMSADAVGSYAQIAGFTEDKIKSGAYAQDDLAAAVRNVAKAYDTANAANSEYLSAVSAFSQSQGTIADRAALIGATLKQSQGDALGYAGTMANAAVANQNLVTSFDAAQKSTVNWKTGVIDFRNAASGPLIANLQQLQDAATASASATYQHVAATGDLKKASADAAAVFRNDTYNALIADASQLGITKDQAKKLADQYFKMPKSVTTTVQDIGTQKIVDVLNRIGEQLGILTGHPWNTSLTTTDQISPTVRAVRRELDSLDGMTAHASIVTTYETVGDRPSAGGRPGTIGRSTGAMGMMVAAYANGGVERHTPQIAKARPNTIRVWGEPETKGESYIPHAADHRRPRAHAIMGLTAKILGGHYTPYDEGGFVGVQNGPLGNAPNSGPTASSRSSSSSHSSTSATAKAASAAAKKAAAEQKKQREKELRDERAALKKMVQLKIDQQKIRVKVDYTDIPKFAKSLTSTTSSVVSALSAMLSDVRNATSKSLGSGALVRTLQSDQTKLTQILQKRDKLSDQLKDANQKLADARSAKASAVSSVASAITGGFDLGGAGQYNGYTTPDRIIAAMQADVTSAGQFMANIKALQAKGLNQQDVYDLANKGVDQAGTNVAALAGASSSQIAQINALRSQLSATGATLGNVVSGPLYDAGINSAKALADGLSSQLGLVQASAKKLAATITSEVKKGLGIHSPSRVMIGLGQNTGQGFALGVSSQAPRVRISARALTAAAQQGGSAQIGNYTASTPGAGGNTTNWNITAVDYDELVAKVQHRQAFAGLA